MLYLRRNILKITLLFMVLLTLLFSLKQIQSFAAGYQNLIRLHIVANSDSFEDQALKRAVRDRVIEELGSEFAEAKDVAAAEKYILENKEKIEDIAKDEAKNWGKLYGASSVLGNFDFPTKSYGTFTLPAGNYRALKVIMGEGKGQNWWCVLYPPLCFVDITKSVADNKELQIGKPKEQKIKIKFKMAEIFSKIIK